MAPRERGGAIPVESPASSFGVLPMIVATRKRHMELRVMSTADAFDFAGAKQKHLAWKSKIRAFLDGKRTMPQGEALSHNECELGQWLFGVGLRKLGKNPLMIELDQKHQKLHALVKEILELKRAGKVEVAETQYAVLLQTSDRIVSLLDELDVSTRKKAA